MTVTEAVGAKVNARDGATAWLNATTASSKDVERGPLYRTLRVEFFRRGVQFVGCDGHMLFRSWAPFSDIGDLPAPQPTFDEAPEDAVTVLDVEQFAVGFMRTLFAATAGSEVPLDLTLAIEPAESEQGSLGSDMQEHVLTLHALGQQLSCKLHEGQFPEWRALQFGVTEDELVDGMTLAPKIFAAVGKLKGVNGIDCTFAGRDRAIHFRSVSGSAPVCGLLMPMSKPTDRGKSPSDDEQMEHEA